MNKRINTHLVFRIFAIASILLFSCSSDSGTNEAFFDPDSRDLKVAAVQMESVNGDIEGNLSHATGFVEQAADLGAELILLPEFMAPGFLFSAEIWDSGEPTNGPTVTWLKSNAERLGVWLGASFLEAEGEDFYNTFVLVDPRGEEAGRVRKQTPALFEAYYTKGDTGTHIIDTELGKIGVGICYENYQCFFMDLMFEGSADLILMPHCAPVIDGYTLSGRNTGSIYAQQLGVPVVMVNKTGEWSTQLLETEYIMDSYFPGLSAIVNSNNIVKAEMGDSEGVLVESVTLSPLRKAGNRPQCDGGFITSEYEYMGGSGNISIEEEGAQWYSASTERAEKAAAISGGE